MKTLRVDAEQRVRLPESKPGQVLSYVNNGDGSFTLTVVKAERAEPFPPGSLAKYFTPEKNREERALLKSTTTRREGED